MFFKLLRVVDSEQVTFYLLFKETLTSRSIFYLNSFRRRDEAYSDTQNFHSNQNRSDRYGSDNRNRSRGPDQNHDDATGHERPPRREHFNSKTFLRSDSRHKRDHYSRDDRNEQPRLHNDVREGNRTDRNDNYNDRTSHNNKRHHDNAYSNARDYTDDSDDSRPGHHQFGGGRRNDRNDIDRRKVTGQYYPDRSQKFIPPRLQKKHQQEVLKVIFRILYVNIFHHFMLLN